MKTKSILLVLLCALGCLHSSRAATTIDPIAKYAYGANIGWMDFTGDTTNGVAIGQYVCSGYVYAGNVGWISLGSGAPTNGLQYQNLSANDFGVNNDGLGNLRGYAYGANIGWISFESNGAPKVDLTTGVLSGSAYSANVGWISLSNAVASVKTSSFFAGTDSDHNGLPDAWEIQYFGHIGVDPSAHTGLNPMTNLQAYQAGTNPNDPTDVLQITAFSAVRSGGNVNASFTWKSHPGRVYQVLQSSSVASGSLWTDVLGSITPDSGDTTTRGGSLPLGKTDFFRVKASLPLQ